MAYCGELIRRGIDPVDAAQTARNMAHARAQAATQAPEIVLSLPDDLFSQAGLPLTLSPTPAAPATSLPALPGYTPVPGPAERPRKISSNRKTVSDDPSGTLLTKRQRTLIEEALLLEQEEAGAAGATGYLARTLAQATLPHSDPKLPPGQLYSRETGKLTLTVSPTSKRHGIPYGSIPRVILAWICTEAVLTKERTLSLGTSQAEFLRKVGLHNNGHDIKRFRDQSMRLFKAVISIEYVDDGVDSSKRLMISDASHVFWHPKEANQKAIWESTLELTQNFFDEIRRAPVPIKMEVCHALTKSPLAMDIYAWLTYRMYVLKVSGRREALIPWIGLKHQFGAGYADTQQGLYNFKLNFKKRMREVLNFYREAENHVSDRGEHLRLTPCKPHVAPRLP